MKRRRFVKYAGASSVAMGMASLLTGAEAYDVNPDLTVKKLNDYLKSLHKIEGDSVDQVIIGNPEALVTKIGTCWMPYWSTLREAVAAGCNTMIVHEPTFYTNYDLRHIEADFTNHPVECRSFYMEQVAKKKKWIEENQLSIIRCHDVLDILPEFGIPYALGQSLGFANKDIIRSDTFYNVYQIPAAESKSVAKKIASKLKLFGQPGVVFYGDENRIVKSVGLGTGYICDPMKFMKIEADLRIAIDDTVRTWIQTYFAEDTGDPLIVINHGTAEENGLRMLNSHLKKVFSKTEVIHFNQGCSYKWIS